ncbi:hypothetical protein CFC21_060888 [Triticum aestivum]|uniref:Uncharacterized protein n=3 Tax=Triticinae TaxID=1648030 RepID=A0A3B6JHH8_WHEAT|nr:early nodulin-20-like [Triticum aestivum]KAF7052861.1 hypothetical protein CFC21_060888 [Triticum aestivum]
MTTRTQPPLPTRPAQAHRRQRAASHSSSSSSSSSFSTASSTASSPSPSPRTTSIPFSWEHHPGIPKSHSFLRGAADPAASPSAPLPLPPPIRAPPSRRRANRSAPGAPGAAAADPFAAALAECTRERTNAIDIDALFPPKPASAVRAGPRRWSIATGGVVGLLDLYGCKNAMGVAEGAFVVRRPVVAVGRAGQGRAGRPGKR